RLLHRAPSRHDPRPRAGVDRDPRGPRRGGRRGSGPRRDALVHRRLRRPRAESGLPHRGPPASARSGPRLGPRQAGGRAARGVVLPPLPRAADRGPALRAAARPSRPQLLHAHPRPARGACPHGLRPARADAPSRRRARGGGGGGGPPGRGSVQRRAQPSHPAPDGSPPGRQDPRSGAASGRLSGGGPDVGGGRGGGARSLLRLRALPVRGGRRTRPPRAGLRAASRQPRRPARLSRVPPPPDAIGSGGGARVSSRPKVVPLRPRSHPESDARATAGQETPRKDGLLVSIARALEGGRHTVTWENVAALWSAAYF